MKKAKNIKYQNIDKNLCDVKDLIRGDHCVGD
jgi:hypothetical protein